jgi:predicted nucleic-acid-binding protein
LLGVDTNILLRWLVDESIWPADDPRQWAAVRKLFNDETKRFYINLIVFAEVFWLIENRLKLSKSAIAEILGSLEAAANLAIQELEAVKAAKASHAIGRAGINDRLIAEMNLSAGCEATMTFDIGASKTAGFRLLKSKE